MMVRDNAKQATAEEKVVAKKLEKKLTGAKSKRWILFPEAKTKHLRGQP